MGSLAPGGSRFTHAPGRFIAAEQKLVQNPPDEDRVDAHLLISVVLGISQHGVIFPQYFYAEPGWTFTRYLVQLEGVYSILGLRFCTLPAPGRDLMAAIAFSVLGYPHQKSTNFIHSNVNTVKARRIS